MESFDPIFIVGVQRSGTTFLRLLLNRHPDIYIPFETNFLYILKLSENTDFSDLSQKKALMKRILEEPLTAKGDIQFSDFERLDDVSNATQMIDMLFEENCQKAGKVRWGVKTPHYVLKMHQIMQLYPNARIIALVRDPRDIFLSQKGISWGIKDPVRMANAWNLAEYSIEMIRTLFPDNIKTVRYEDLIRNTEGMVKEICDFVQCDFQPSLLNFDNNPQTMPTDSVQWHQKSMQKPDVNKIYAWKTKLNKYEKAVFANMSGELLKKWGYEADKVRFNVVEKVIKKIRNAILYA
ncbi:sulfotransferase family protein [Neptunicella sp. SCSIO 80796]|uniref:sulfotransferase family protein n=1 Tax=Neptunicella plasticusilytica TaxID=3117012 RepID=UPI003A4D81F3